MPGQGQGSLDYGITTYYNNEKIDHVGSCKLWYLDSPLTTPAVMKSVDFVFYNPAARGDFKMKVIK